MNFYIIGLPRSRSKWFSELLTYDTSVCYHERLFQKPAFIKQALPNIGGIDYVGTADTNPLYFDAKLVGDSPTIIVRRNLSASIESYTRTFAPHSDPTELLTAMKKALTEIEVDNQLVVDFENLNDINVINSIIEFVTPNIVMPKERILKLMDTDIVVNPNMNVFAEQHTLFSHIKT